MSTTTHCIDPIGDELFGCAAIARLVREQTGHRCDRSTVSRWITQGRIGRDGRRHRLEAVRIGSRLYSTREALRAYIRALSEPAPAGDPDHQADDCDDDHLAAERELAERGI
jgi:hypothetical protein